MNKSHKNAMKNCTNGRKEVGEPAASSLCRWPCGGMYNFEATSPLLSISILCYFSTFYSYILHGNVVLLSDNLNDFANSDYQYKI